MMLVLAAKFRTKEGKREELVRLAKEMIGPSRAEQGCVSYAFYQEEGYPEHFLFFEEWEDRDALERHFRTPWFLNFSEKYPEILEGEPLLTIYEVESTKSVA